MPPSAVYSFSMREGAVAAWAHSIPYWAKDETLPMLPSELSKPEGCTKRLPSAPLSAREAMTGLSSAPASLSALSPRPTLTSIWSVVGQFEFIPVAFGAGGDFRLQPAREIGP